MIQWKPRVLSLPVRARVLLLLLGAILLLGAVSWSLFEARTWLRQELSTAAAAAAPYLLGSFEAGGGA